MSTNHPYVIRAIHKHEARSAHLFMKENTDGTSILSTQHCYHHAQSIFVCEQQQQWLGVIVSFQSPRHKTIAIIECMAVKPTSNQQELAKDLVKYVLEYWKQQCVFNVSFMAENISEATIQILHELQFKLREKDGFEFYQLKLLPERLCVNNRVMRPSMNTINGEVSEDTLFEYFQKDDVIWGTYSGGTVVRGVLLGRMARNGNIDFEYKQLSNDGQVYSGVSKSTTEFLNDGRIVLYEDWEWTGNRKGGGRSVIEEIKE